MPPQAFGSSGHCDRKGLVMGESDTRSQVGELAQLKQRVERRDLLAADCAELREKIEEMERELNGIAFWLEEGEREIQKLNGSGLTGLLLAAVGKRTERVEAKTKELEGLREDHAAYGGLLESARRDLAKLENEVEQLGDAREAYIRCMESRREALAASSDESGDALRALSVEKAEVASRVKSIVAAIEAGREALDHLHDEVHVMGMMGRCRAVEANGILRSVMNSGRKQVVAECSGRARHSLTRFQNRIAASGLGEQTMVAMGEADQLLAGMSRQVRTNRLTVKTINAETVGRIDEIVRECLGLLEDRLTREKARVTQIDERVESLLEAS
ncbi:MAG: hypothetical protein H6818_21185 [Phycisphaerales bacterium]|nr:hypothetical protein [Phycisphaerales bacterium]MCB9862307.1 hypothetical protein [Phycisphaerales bacterium]